MPRVDSTPDTFVTSLRTRADRFREQQLKPQQGDGNVLDFSRLTIVTPDRLQLAIDTAIDLGKAASVGDYHVAAPPTQGEVVIDCGNHHRQHHPQPHFSLSLSHNAIPPSLRTKLLRQNLASMPGIDGVDLYGIQLGDEDIPAIVEMLQKNAGIRKLKIGDNLLTAAGIAALSLALRAPLRAHTASQLVQLHLGGNVTMGDDGVAALASLLPLTSVEKLGLRSVGMTAAGATALARAFKCSPTSLNVTELQMRENDIGDAGLLALLETLPHSLTTLDLQATGISDASTVALCVRLATANHNGLRELALDRNGISDAGAAAMGEMLSSSVGCGATLCSLTLRSNTIGDPGAALLFAGLSRNRSISSLSIGQNPIGAGACAFVDVLRSMCPLIAIDFGGCNLPSYAIERLLDELAADDAPLKVLDLTKNFMGDAAVPAFCRMLRSNKSITRLIFPDNEVSCSGMDTVLRAMDANTSVRFMVFGGQSTVAPVLNNVSPATRAALNGLIARNRSLRALSVKGTASDALGDDDASDLGSPVRPAANGGVPLLTQDRPTIEAVHAADRSLAALLRIWSGNSSPSTTQTPSAPKAGATLDPAPFPSIGAPICPTPPHLTTTTRSAAASRCALPAAPEAIPTDALASLAAQPSALFDSAALASIWGSGFLDVSHGPRSLELPFYGAKVTIHSPFDLPTVIQI